MFNLSSLSFSSFINLNYSTRVNEVRCKKGGEKEEKRGKRKGGRGG